MIPASSIIHPSAILLGEISLGKGIQIGPLAVVQGPVVLEDQVTLGPHAVILPYVRIESHTLVAAHAIVGGVPQMATFVGQETWVHIGANSTLREGVTVHRSTHPEKPTRVGSGCYLMAYSHVAHDCELGQNVTLANNVMLGGHVTLGDFAFLGGGAAVHQFVRIGTGAMVGGLAGVTRDVLPFTVAVGIPARHSRLNEVGLRRMAVPLERQDALKGIYTQLEQNRILPELLTPEGEIIRDFMKAPSRFGLADFYT